MHDARDSQKKGRIVNHQQTRVYSLFAMRFFLSKDLACISKKVRMRIFPLVMCAHAQFTNFGRFHT